MKMHHFTSFSFIWSCVTNTGTNWQVESWDVHSSRFVSSWEHRSLPSGQFSQTAKDPSVDKLPLFQNLLIDSELDSELDSEMMKTFRLLIVKWWKHFDKSISNKAIATRHRKSCVGYLKNRLKSHPLSGKTNLIGLKLWWIPYWYLLEKKESSNQCSRSTV